MFQVIIKTTNLAAVYAQDRRGVNNIRKYRVFSDKRQSIIFFGRLLILFVNKYRLSRPMVIKRFRLIQKELARLTNRSHAMPVSLQIPVTFRFM